MKYTKYLENFILLSFTLIPILLITGPFLPDLFLSLSSISFLILCFKYQLWKKLYDYNVVKFFFLFCILILLRSLFSENIRLSLESSLFYFRFGLFSLGIFYLVPKQKKFIKYTFYVLIIIYLCLFLDGFYQFFAGKNIIGFVYNDPHNFRITSFFGEDEVLGSYIVRLFPFTLYLYFFLEFNKKDRNYVIISLLFCLSFLTIILSGERTALALFAITILIFLFSSKFLKKIFFYLLIAMICFSSVITIFDKRIKHRVYDQTFNQIFNEKEDRIVIFSKIYEGHYKIALNMFFEKPLIGHGTKTFRYYCSKPENFVSVNACSTHPHNILMQFLSETGVLGTAFYVLVLYFLSILLLKNLYLSYYKRKEFLNDKLLCLTVFYMVNLFPFLPSGNFFNNWLSIIYFLPAGMYMYEIYQFKSKNL